MVHGWVGDPGCDAVGDYLEFFVRHAFVHFVLVCLNFCVPANESKVGGTDFIPDVIESVKVVGLLFDALS